MKSSFDIIPFLKPDDPFLQITSFEDVQRYYDLKYRIANLLKPKSILEIGVRAGYSAAAFISASNPDVYLGIDFDSCNIDKYFHGGCVGFSGWALESLKSHFPRVDIKMINMDTQTEKIKLDRIYDLVHVDGDHSFDGCYHDLNQVEEYANWILVDDYFHIDEVRKAVDAWLSEKKYESISLPGFRGEKIIKVKS